MFSTEFVKNKVGIGTKLYSTRYYAAHLGTPNKFSGTYRHFLKIPCLVGSFTLSGETGKRGNDARAETPLLGLWGEERRKTKLTSIIRARDRAEIGRVIRRGYTLVRRLAPGDAKQQGVPRVLLSG